MGVMHKLPVLLKRFRKDESGVFFVLFGLLALVLIATAGAVIDYTSVEQARTRAQDALDSAALGLQPSIFDTPTPTTTALKAKAQALIAERMANESVSATVDTATINLTDGTLHLEAQLSMNTAFVALVGVPTIKARIQSEATRKKLNIEIAMVLDNSGSMDQSSRMTNLKLAATCAINILYNNAANCNTSTMTTTTPLASVNPTVKIGIVPFTSFVNVGSSYSTATWMDKGNGADLANDNFRTTDEVEANYYTGAVNRFTLFSQLTGVSWQGCVESRKYPYDTNDTVPSTGTPDTLFVPEFAPDEPDGQERVYNWWSGWQWQDIYPNNYLPDYPAACTRLNGSCVWHRVKTKCTSWSSCNATTGTDKVDATYTKPDGTTVTTTNNANPVACTCSAVPTGNPSQTIVNVVDSGTGVYTGTGSNKTYTQTITCNYQYAPAGLSQRVVQERMCKYTGTPTSGRAGPNQDCPTNALQPLTATKADVVTAITAMYPQGFTNIHQGAIWGFHMLSPTEPLTQGNAYTTATYKVMIIMTDGENTYGGWDSDNMNGGDAFWAYGYPWNNPGGATAGDNKRMRSTAYGNPSSESKLITAQNTRTVETCNNAKAAPSNIKIFTVGLSAPNDTVKQMLKDCSNGVGYWYFPTSSSDLVDVFKDIASQLSNLRLAK